MAERRRTVRAVARIDVYDEGAHQKRVPLYISGNVSAGGIFLITNEPFEPGTEMKISFTLPDDREPINTVGQVIWKRQGREAADRQPGMGVQFHEISREDHERVRAFVYEQAEKGNIVEED